MLGSQSQSQSQSTTPNLFTFGQGRTNNGNSCSGSVGKTLLEEIKQFLLEYAVKNGQRMLYSGDFHHMSWFFINRENNLQTTIKSSKKGAPNYNWFSAETFSQFETIFFQIVKKEPFSNFAKEKGLSELILKAANNFFFAEAIFTPDSEDMNSYFEVMLEFISTHPDLMKRFAESGLKITKQQKCLFEDV